VAVTMCREAFDDFTRFLRDKEVNSQVYKKVTKKGNQWINRDFQIFLINGCTPFRTV
jgi:sRNA-binding regulator protein Hfq